MKLAFLEIFVSIAVLSLPAIDLEAQTVRIYPDDPGLHYSETVTGRVNHQQAHFDRKTVNFFGNDH